MRERERERERERGVGRKRLDIKSSMCEIMELGEHEKMRIHVVDIQINFIFLSKLILVLA